PMQPGERWSCLDRCRWMRCSCDDPPDVNCRAKSYSAADHLINPTLPLKTFYKKGCQEKKLRLDRRGEFFLEIQPTEVSTSLEKFGLLFILVSFSAAGDAAVEFKRAASELVASEATMVLSEARGLWLFLVIREGIGCKWVTRCRSTQGRTVLTDTPLE